MLSEQSPGLETIPLILQRPSVTERIELHFLPKDVETDDLCRSPQTPSSQLERGCVSIYFLVSPCPLFKIRTLCVQAAAGVFVVVDAADFFFFNLPHLATSEKQTIWQKIISGGAPEREPE